MPQKDTLPESSATPYDTRVDVNSSGLTGKVMAYCAQLCAYEALRRAVYV